MQWRCFSRARYEKWTLSYVNCIATMKLWELQSNVLLMHEYCHQVRTLRSGHFKGPQRPSSLGTNS
jgi:hypothetical protein